MDLFNKNIDNDILILYNQSMINSQVTKYKIDHNTDIFRNIWYNINLNISPIQASKINNSFADIEKLLTEKEKVLQESHLYVSEHLNKNKDKVYKNDFIIIYLALFILLFIITNSKTT